MIFFEMLSPLFILLLFFTNLCFGEQLFVLFEVVDFELNFTFLDWNAFLYPDYLSIVHFYSLPKLVKHLLLHLTILLFKKFPAHLKSFVRFKGFRIENHLLF